MADDVRYAVNCSLLFTEHPLLERAAAASAEGFDAVEFWWPWPDQPVPPDAAVDAFVGSVRDAGVRLVGLNFFAGDLFGPDCGVLSLPGSQRQFLDNVDVVVEIGATLGVGAFNALYGNRVESSSPDEQDELATANLVAAAAAAARVGATVLVEPVSGPKPYPLRTAADVAGVLDRLGAAGVTNAAMLCDLFHLANNGDDLDAAITTYGDRIGHVQIADHPGRGEPGSGQLDLDGYLGKLQAAGYAGYVALEYNPTTTTHDSLRWLPVAQRSAT